MTIAGKRLIQAALEARDIARGDAEPIHIHVPAEMDVKAIRLRTGYTQDDFATAYGFSVNQIRDWEQCRSRPLGGIRAYLMMIRNNHEAVRILLEEAMIAQKELAQDENEARAM